MKLLRLENEIEALHNSSTNKIYFLFRRLDVLQACCSKFPHYFKTISTVMFPLWLKSRFPSALVALLWQAAFDFPNRLFLESGKS